MSFLPIIAREMLIAARRPLTYYSRCLAAIVAISVCLGLVYSTVFGVLSPAALGAEVLFWLGCIGFVYAAIEGVLITSDAIAAEKRDGTIGLLFLTDLRAHDIVIGKLFARSWHAFGAILAGIPAPALTVLIGGLILGDVARVILVLLAMLFFSASVGIFFSACFRSGIKSMFASLMAISGVLLSLPLMTIPVATWWWRLVCIVLSPLAAPDAMFLSASSRFYKGLPPLRLPVPLNSFGSAFAVTILSGIVMLAMASVVLRRSWQENSAPQVSWIARLTTRLGRTKFARFFEPRKNPISTLAATPSLWMAERQQGTGFALWGGFLMLTIAGILVIELTLPSRIVFPLLGSIAIANHYVLKFRLAVKACRSFADDRRTGALEILLTTGLDTEEIIRGHLLSLKKQFFVPTLLTLGFDAAVVVSFAFFQDPWAGIVLGTGAFIFAMVQLLDMYALAWVGLWLGLKTAEVALAVRRVLVHAIIGQWSILAAICLVLAMSTGRPEPLVPAAIFLVICCAANASNCCNAYSRLQDDLRATAAQIPSPPRTPFLWIPFRARHRAPQSPA